MLLDKVRSNNVFDTEQAGTKGKTIGEYSKKEWEKMLKRVDNAIEAYKEDLKEREEEAVKQQKKREEQNVCEQQKKERQKYEQNVMGNKVMQNMRFQHLNENKILLEQSEEEKADVKKPVADSISEEAIQKIIGNRGKMPYATLADENGIITYNGVTFVGDMARNSLCLGDMTDIDNILTIQLSDGGYLKVNLDDLDSLSKAIGMFSPEDQNRIMRAIAQHNRIKQIQQQIEDETSGLQVLEKKEDIAFYA